VEQNVANVNTAGYKAGRLVFRVRPLDETAAGPTTAPFAGTAAQVAEVATIRDFSTGPIRTSGNPLDVAINGDGFFVVSTPQGERYTRQGTFSMDAEGFLVTPAGLRVQGDGGEINLRGGGTGSAPSIGDDGTVIVDRSEVGRLRIVSFGDEPALVPEGNALFAAVPGTFPTPVEQSSVRLAPEAYEGSNVDAVGGMIELVDVTRGFETYMSAMKRLDEIVQRAINDIGRVG
jgi:flagellar basal body rod protein FlgG